MKVSPDRYQVVSTRVFILTWFIYTILAVSFYFGFGELIDQGSLGFRIAVGIALLLIGFILSPTGYFFWMGVQGFGTEVYPPVGYWVLSNWDTAEGVKARIYGLALAVPAAVASVSLLLLFLIVLAPNWFVQ